MAAENAFQILCATRKKIHINQNIMIASTLVEPKLKIEIILLIVFFEEKKICAARNYQRKTFNINLTNFSSQNRK